MRSSGVKGTVWTFEDQSEVKKLSRRLILRGQILSDHVDWPPLWFMFHFHSIDADTHCSGPQFSQERPV